MPKDRSHPRTYYASIDPDLVARYEYALQGVIRYKNPQFPSIVAGFEENDLTHTRNTGKRFHHFLDACPSNASFLEHDIETVDDMLYLHEAGEPIAGDTPLSIEDFRTIDSLSSTYVRACFTQKGIENPTKQEVRALFAHAEHVLFLRYGLSLIKDREMRNRVKTSYLRFETPSGDDYAAHLAKIFDILDGNHTALLHYMNRNPEMGAVTEKDYRSGVESDASRLVTAIARYTNFLPPELVKEAITYFLGETKIYSDCGYEEAYLSIKESLMVHYRGNSHT